MRRRWLVVLAVGGLVAAVLVARRSGVRAPAPASTAIATSTAAPTETSTGAPAASAPATSPATATPDAPASGAEVPAATIDGVVVDPLGRPVPGETVGFAPTIDGKFDLSALPFSDTVTGEDGAFSVEVEVGEYLVQVSGDDAPTARARVHAPVRGVRLRLSRGASIDGVLLDGGGAPVAAGRVTVASVGEHESEPPETRYAATDARGRFRILGLEAGAWMVLGARQLRGGDEPELGSNTASQRVELAPQQAAAVELRLGPERTIAGTVVDETGAGIAGAQVSAELADDALGKDGVAHLRGSAEATTDAQGRFALEGLPDGAHALDVECRGYADPEPGRHVEAGVRDVRVVLRRLAQLRGRVVGEDGAPLARFTVNGQPIEAGDGRFELPIARTGRMSLTVTADGHVPLHHAIRVAAGVSADAGDLRLGRTRAFRGQVVAADSGAPLAGARVSVGHPAERRHAIGLEREGAGTLTDAAGRFTVEAAGDGVELEATAEGYGPALLAIAPGQASGTIRLGRGARIAVRALDAAGAPIRALGIGVLAIDGDPQPVAVGAVDADGRWVTRDLAAGTYLVLPLHAGIAGEGTEADPRRDAPPALRTRTVRLSAGQTVDVELREATAGTTVVVKLTGPGVVSPEEVGVALAPGDATHVRTMADAMRAVGAGIIAEDRGTSRTFGHVEPGRHTVLVLAGDEDAPAVLTRAVDVAAAGEQVIELEVPAELPALSR
jgi:uncharacterized GH25 family protein